MGKLLYSRREREQLALISLGKNSQTNTKRKGRDGEIRKKGHCPGGIIRGTYVGQPS